MRGRWSCSTPKAARSWRWHHTQVSTPTRSGRIGIRSSPIHRRRWSNRATLGRYPGEALVSVLLPDDNSSQFAAFDPLLRLPGGEVTASDEYSPMQVALLAAAISNGGVMPAPSLVQAVKAPSANWEALPPLQEPQQILSEEEAIEVSTSNKVEDLDLWQVSGWMDRQRSDQPVTWYASGTLPSWAGRRLALAVLLEEDNPDLAASIGQSVLQTAMGR